MAKKVKVKERKEELSVTIYTPDGIKVEVMAANIVAPGEEGDMMIMPDHCGLIVPLRIGVMQISHPDSVDYYSISGGTLSVENNSVGVSAFAAEHGKDIDAGRAERAKQRAESVLASDAERDIIREARVALYRALIRLEAHKLARSK